MFKKKEKKAKPTELELLAPNGNIKIVYAVGTLFMVGMVGICFGWYFSLPELVYTSIAILIISLIVVIVLINVEVYNNNKNKKKISKIPDIFDIDNKDKIEKSKK